MLPASDSPESWFKHVPISLDEAARGLKGFADEDACHKYETTDQFIELGAAHLLNQFYERYPDKVGKVAIVPPESSYHFRDGRYEDFWRSVKVICRSCLQNRAFCCLCTTSVLPGQLLRVVPRHVKCPRSLLSTPPNHLSHTCCREICALRTPRWTRSNCSCFRTVAPRSAITGACCPWPTHTARHLLREQSFISTH